MTEEEVREKARHKTANELLEQRAQERVRAENQSYRGR